MTLRRLYVGPALLVGSSLVLMLVVGLALSASLAGPALAQPVRMEYNLQPNTLKQGEAALGTLIVDNQSAENMVLDGVSIEVAEGLAYVGQAAGSDVETTANAEGTTLRWTDRFRLAAGERLTLRYWAVAATAVPGQHLTQATISLSGETWHSLAIPLVVEPGELPALGEGALDPSSPAMPDAIGDISTSKTATPATVDPGSAVAYTVVFNNSSSSPQPLDTITDVLPAPFQYVGLAAGSQVTVEPEDTEEPAIVWLGSFNVPGNGSLTLRYWAWVPDETEPGPTPFINTVTAAYEGATTESGEETVTIAAPDIQVTKTVWPPEVMALEPVTYTLRLENVGNGEGVIDLITDTLPKGFAFEEMVPGGTIMDAPVGFTGTIVWHGPIAMPVGTVETVKYQVRSGLGSGLEPPTNRAGAVVNGEPTDPASVPVQVNALRTFMPIVLKNYTFPYFVATKTASATQVLQGGKVTYTLRFTNPGSGPAELDIISDTLPAGFTFLQMVAGSDLMDPPSDTTGPISWDLEPPLAVVGAGQSLTLKYEVQVSDIPGTYVNEATATTLVGRAPDEPAVATVKVHPPYLLSEDFETGTDGWEPFLNYWRLHPEQWYLQGGAGRNGSVGLRHSRFLGVTDPDRGAHDALYMYRGDGAEQWTDYRVEAWVRLDAGSYIGLWVRGKYFLDQDDGKHVEGYYVGWRPNRDRDAIKLSRLRTTGGTAYHFSDPIDLASDNGTMYTNTWYHMAVEVRGSNIKVFVNGELRIDHNDATFSEGTIGFVSYEVDYGTWDDILVTPLN